MAEVNINEITSDGDVDFDQNIDSDTLIAGAGGFVANGDVDDSTVVTGRNEGIIANDDVDVEGSVIGDGNTQISNSDVGAFAGRGNATNAQGENVALGGDVTDIDTDGGDAQLVTGIGNRVSGDTDIDLEGNSGPTNLTIGDDNNSNALQDNSTTVEDSFNTDNSIDDSFNTDFDDSFNTRTIDTDIVETNVDDSFNTSEELNELTNLEFESSFEDNSSFQDNDRFAAEVEATDSDVDVDLDGDLDL